MLAGTAIYAFGIHFFLIPNQFMEGGLTGIALLLNYTLDIPPSYTTLILNIPLFYVGWRYFGGRTMLYTVVCTIALSVFLWLMERCIRLGWIVPFQTEHDFFLATLYAGVTIGTGLGLVFRFGGTTGGVDIIARIVNKKRGLSMGQIILMIDVLVIGSSYFYIAGEMILYTLVMVFISSRIIDFIQEGAYAAKAFTIITDHPEEISKKIGQELDRGATLFHAKGSYTKQAKEVVYCVVYRNEVRRMRILVRAIDPRAFMIVHDVQDVMGEGFKPE
ncbi:YitT family protein [Xylanibacillus composti]|nr:YitT family protein [Xylanibacillus composti]MDT9725486.1 YitT family protein [Xylanibacillus composti]